jgi:hypothetical protein
LRVIVATLPGPRPPRVAPGRAEAMLGAPDVRQRLADALLAEL